MSYHLDRLGDSRHQMPQRLPYPTYPVTYPLPVGEVVPSTGMDPLLKALAVVVAIAVALYLIDRFTGESEEPVKKNPGKKMSTRDMARKLYERLEKNGSVNETTMRSLAQIGRKK